ncbi:MAG: sensor domain-containing diguanylate cyclase [Candidatus Eisenbacteria bacterium]
MQRRTSSRRARVSTRELLHRLIPVDRLDAESREEYLRLLSMDDEGSRLQGTAALLEKLCELGYLRRVAGGQANGSPSVTYRNLTTLDTIRLTLPSAPVPRRAAVPGGAPRETDARPGNQGPVGEAPGSEAAGLTRERGSLEPAGGSENEPERQRRAQTFLPKSILEAVAAASRRIDLASAMSYLYDLLKDVVGCDRCAIFMSTGLSGSPAGRLSELEEVFRWQESDMISPGELKLRVEESGQVVSIPDLSDAGQFGRRLSRGAAGSLVVSPLRAEAYVYGVLEVWSGRPHTYTSDEITIIDFVAEFVGGLIKRRLEVEELIFVDQTSQIHNRRYFDEQLAREVERCRRTGNAMALLIGDLDDFKRVNDTMGHAAGDSVLRQVGRILSENARQLDIVARMGGEEFGVILPNVERDTALTVAERIRSTIAGHRFVTGIRETPTCEITMSIGGALYPLDAKSRADLFDKADRIALYEAKRRGKNQVIFWRDIQSD